MLHICGRFRFGRDIRALLSMKFTREVPANVNLIRAHSERTVRIGDREIASNCLVSASELIEHWPVRSVAELALADLEPLLAWQPDIVLLGTGARQQFPSRAVYAGVLARGVGFEVMETGAACRTFNVLVSEDRRVALALLFG